MEQTAKTVKQLRDILAQYPDDMLLLGEGPDSGGYDIEWKTGICVVSFKDHVDELNPLYPVGKDRLLVTGDETLHY